MKHFFITFMALTAVLAVNAQEDNHGHGQVIPAVQQPGTGDEVLKFKETEHDFGQIAQGKPVYFNFTITNTGTKELKLDNVQASCGCTTPEWSKDPIAPGASAVIKVGYNAAVASTFEKYITVTYNSNQSKQIKIKGTVWQAPEGSAPANSSVDFLKKQTF